MSRHTLKVRYKPYRGQWGWSLTGKPPGQEGGWPVSMFFEHESAARRTFRQLRDGEPLDPDPFAP